MTITLVRTGKGLEGLTFSDRWNLQTLVGNARPLAALDHNASTRLRRRLAKWGIRLVIPRSPEIVLGMSPAETLAMSLPFKGNTIRRRRKTA
jgi:hypothetical protein